MSGSLGRVAAALLRWGRGAGGLLGAGARAAGSGTSSGSSSVEQLDPLVKKDKEVVFLKRTPEQPQCGFGNAVVQILRLHGVRDYAAYNGWTTPDSGKAFNTIQLARIPRVYLNGKFVGGCDILLQMHHNGDLMEKLKKLGICSILFR